MTIEISDFNDVVKVPPQGIRCKGERVSASDPRISLLISETCIEKRVEKIAEQIAADFKEDINCVVVLQGGMIFFSDLSRDLAKKTKKHVYYSSIKAKSYKGTESTGKVTVEHDCGDVAGKDVFIVEDIIDTGVTMDFLIRYLKDVKKAKSVKVCAVLDKPSRRVKKVKIDYLGFEIPDLFVVGYGLDYNQQYRCLPFIGVINKL